jgi:hypothetical protein
VEYSTQYLDERNYLTDHGIRYSFVSTNEDGIRTFKYKKTSKLFQLLAEFYKK